MAYDPWKYERLLEIEDASLRWQAMQVRCCGRADLIGVVGYGYGWECDVHRWTPGYKEDAPRGAEEG
jgi:hypothetical protein